MRRLLREPLLHFVVLGALIFAGYSMVAGEGGAPREAIVVPAGKIEHLATLFEKTWQRPPTRQELDGLVQDHVREEVAYREGLAAGLDRDDTIIRRRLRQKLEFLAEDFASRSEPSDAELAAYLAAHPDDFRVEPRVGFRHVFLDPEERGTDLEADAEALLIALEGDPGRDSAMLGDRILLEPGYEDVSPREVADLFGARFAAALAGLRPGAWHGPIDSAYGAHLVRLQWRAEGRVPALEEVRGAVRREWENERRGNAMEAFYREMLARYEVRVEWPEPASRGDES